MVIRPASRILKSSLVTICILLIFAAPLKAERIGQVRCTRALIKMEKVCSKKKVSKACKAVRRNVSHCRRRSLIPPKDPVVCFALYDPVCAIDTAGETKTYSNSCVASTEGATVISQGECPATAAF